MLFLELKIFDLNLCETMEFFIRTNQLSGSEECEPILTRFCSLDKKVRFNLTLHVYLFSIL